MGTTLIIAKQIGILFLIFICICIACLILNKLLITKVETYEVREEDEKYNGYYDE